MKKFLRCKIYQKSTPKLTEKFWKNSVRLMKNHKAQDCAYPGVEVLPDGTIVATTYGHWIVGELPFIVSVRLKLAEIDARMKP